MKKRKRNKKTIIAVLGSIEENQAERRYTRTINSKLGFLGILGLLGFVGFIPLHLNGSLAVPFPFLFFCFFGFFGFFYEGKMSHTLIDERFQMNSFRAEAAASKAALTIIIMVPIFAVSLFRVQSAYTMVCILLITIGIAFGLSTFLSQYLLYHYDCED